MTCTQTTASRAGRTPAFFAGICFSLSLAAYLLFFAVGAISYFSLSQLPSLIVYGGLPSVVILSLAIYCFSFFWRRSGRTFLVAALFAGAGLNLFCAFADCYSASRDFSQTWSEYRTDFLFLLIVPLAAAAAFLLFAVGKLTRSRGTLLAAMIGFTLFFLIGRVWAITLRTAFPSLFIWFTAVCFLIGMICLLSAERKRLAAPAA